MRSFPSSRLAEKNPRHINGRCPAARRFVPLERRSMCLCMPRESVKCSPTSVVSAPESGVRSTAVHPAGYSRGNRNPWRWKRMNSVKVVAGGLFSEPFLTFAGFSSPRIEGLADTLLQSVPSYLNRNALHTTLYTTSGHCVEFSHIRSTVKDWPQRFKTSNHGGS